MSNWRQRLRGWFVKDERAAHLKTGDWGEREAARFLKKQGYKILGRNVRFGKKEELDLVARDGEVLVFIEVKTRSSEAMIRPAAAVTRAKRKALRRAAKSYMSRLRNVDRKKLNYRFDIIEVLGSPGMESRPEIRHIKRAFSIHDRT